MFDSFGHRKTSEKVVKWSSCSLKWIFFGSILCYNIQENMIVHAYWWVTSVSIHRYTFVFSLIPQLIPSRSLDAGSVQVKTCPNKFKLADTWKCVAVGILADIFYGRAATFAILHTSHFSVTHSVDAHCLSPSSVVLCCRFFIHTENILYAQIWISDLWPLNYIMLPNWFIREMRTHSSARTLR